MTHNERIQGYVLFGLLAGTAVLAFLIFRPFLAPLALAAIFAIVLHPVYRFFLRHGLRWRSLAAFATIIISTFLILAPLSLMAVLVIGEAQQTYVSLTQGAGLANTQDAILYLGDTFEPYAPGSAEYAARLAENVNSYIAGGLGWLVANVGPAFSGALHLVLSLIIFFIALYAFLRNGPVIRESLLYLSPFNDRDDERIFDRLVLTINSVVRGSLTAALIQGIVATTGYIIFGLPNPVLWGLLTSVAALVPGVGTALVVAPAVGYLLIAGETFSAFGLLIWGVAAIGLIDDLLGPILMGRGVRLPPLVILLAVLGGVAFFGPAGIFLGPLTVSLLLVLFTLYADSNKKTV